MCCTVQRVALLDALYCSASCITRCSALFSMSCIAKYAPSGAYLFELHLSAEKNAVNKIGTISCRSQQYGNLEKVWRKVKIFRVVKSSEVGLI